MTDEPRAGRNQPRQIDGRSMMMARIPVVVAAAILALLAARPAMAFEVEGLRAGMTLAEARAIAQRRQMTLRPVPAITGVYSVARAGEEPHGTITFCGNRDALFAYTGFNVGGFDAFVRMVERETGRLGQGAYSTSITEGTDGPIYEMRVEWREVFWRVSVAAHIGPRLPVAAARGLNAFDTFCR